MHKPFASLTKQQIRGLADSKTIYCRGEEYFHSGAVAKVWIEDAKLFAKVFGGHGEYKVTIEDYDGEFSCHCTCPYEGQNCKHIVATCLAFLGRRDDLLMSARQKDRQHSDLHEQLLTLDKADLADLLALSLKTHRDWKNTLLRQLADRFKRKGSAAVNQKIYEERFANHFDRVCEILQECNEYGGGPEEEEDDVYEQLEEIVKLFKDEDLSEQLKRQFIDKMFFYYDWGNSGLADAIMDSIFEVAKTKEDWEYVVGKLRAKKDSSHYRQSLIITIYRDHLKDDEQYLKLRQQDLRWGGDYYDLVQYWHKRGDSEKALATAKEGIQKFNHGTDELLEYLFGYYKNKDYAGALVYLKRIFVEQHNLEQYKRLQKFAQKEDWQALDQWCRNMLRKEKALDELARVHRFNNEYDKVLEFVLSDTRDSWAWDDGNRERFAEELTGRYPNELVPFYEGRVERHIARMGRKDYHKAAHFAKKLKEIYCTHLNQKEAWQKFVDGIRKKYSNRRALLEEFGGL